MKQNQTWFSRLVQHLARKRSGSILTTPEPARGNHLRFVWINYHRSPFSPATFSMAVHRCTSDHLPSWPTYLVAEISATSFNHRYTGASDSALMLTLCALQMLVLLLLLLLHRSAVGSRAFPVVGPQLWNTLPFQVTSARLLEIFRRRLKTWLVHAVIPGHTHAHRRRSRGGQRGQLPHHLQTRGEETVSNAPPPFRRLSGMMPASTEKNHRHI